MTAVAVLHREEIIEQVAQGVRLIDIARRYGLTTHATISQTLSKDPEYIAARESGLEARLETRESEVEQADDQLTLARARELLGHARWRCEREMPERWGGKGLNINVVGQVNIDTELGQAADALLGKLKG